MTTGEFKKTIGTRAEVYHGTARRTSGGLTKSELMMNKHGRIVSKKKHNTAKREMRLVKYGFLTKKGKFGFIKGKSKKHSSRSSRSSRSSKSKRSRRSRKMRGGNYASVGDKYTLDDFNPSGVVSDSEAFTKMNPSNI
jgi:hypothetical protein